MRNLPIFNQSQCWQISCLYLRYRPKAQKTGSARVLTSSEHIRMLEERERKKREEAEKKERRRQERLMKKKELKEKKKRKPRKIMHKRKVGQQSIHSNVYMFKC